MSDYLAADGTFINSIVGEGTRFRGELDLDGLLRIDGDYFGSIKTTGKVLVGKNGRAECTIRAGTVVIGGVVKGNIVSTEKVIILSSGILIGNVSSPRLIVEEGVLIDGSCQINQHEFNPDMAFPEVPHNPVRTEKPPVLASAVLNELKLEGEEAVPAAEPVLVQENLPETQNREQGVKPLEENKEYTVWKG